MNDIARPVAAPTAVARHRCCAALLAGVTLLAGWPIAAMAQGAVYRCEVQGRVSYGDTPCDNGRVLEVEQPRPAADVRAAERVAASDQRLAQRLTTERQRDERRAAAAGPAGFRTTPPGAASPAEKPRKAWDVARDGPIHPPHLHQPKRQPAARGTSPSAAPGSRRAAG
jgi:hypothetical protein